MAEQSGDVPLSVIDNSVANLAAVGARSLSVADEQKQIRAAISASDATRATASGNQTPLIDASDSEMTMPTSFPAFAPTAPVRAADFLGNGRWRKEPLAIFLATSTFIVVFAIFKYGLSEDFHNCWDDCVDLVPCTPYTDSFYKYSFVLTLYGSVGILPRIFGLWRSILFGTKRQQHFAGVPVKTTTGANGENSDGSPRAAGSGSSRSVVAGTSDGSSTWWKIKEGSGWWQTLLFASAQVVVTFFVNAGLKEGHTVSFPLGLIGLPAFFSLIFGGWKGLYRYLPYIVFGLLVSILTSVIMWLFPTLHQSFGQTGFEITLSCLPIVLNVIEYLFLGIVGNLRAALDHWTDEQLVWLAALLLIGVQSVSIGMLLSIQSAGLIALNIILDATLDICDRLDMFHRVVYMLCFTRSNRPEIPRLESIYAGCKVLFDLVPIAAYVLMAAFNYSPSGGSEDFNHQPHCTSTPLLDKFQLDHTWPIVIGILFAQTVADVFVFYGGHFLFQRERLKVIEAELENERKANTVEGKREKERLRELMESKDKLGRQLTAMKSTGDHRRNSKEFDRLQSQMDTTEKELKDALADKPALESPRQSEKPELIRRASDIVKGKSNYRFGGEGRVVEFANFGNLFLLMLSSFFFALLGLEGAGIVLTLIEKNQETP